MAPDLFHRAGGGTAPHGDFSRVLPLFEGLDDAALVRDVAVGRDALVAAGWTDRQIGIPPDLISPSFAAGGVRGG